MHKKIVVLIQSDPRTSRRPCEGIRIALGLISSAHQVSVILAKDAPRILQADKTDFVDEDRLAHFLAAFEGFSDVFFVDATRAEKSDFSGEILRATRLSQEGCAEKIAQADCFFTF